VDNLYNLRLQYPKSDPLNYIAKLLLNSLYGRFGMDDNFSEINIIHKEFIGDFENKFLDLIISKTELDEYILVETKTSDLIDNDDSVHNVSIAIAAAITSYARIHMSQFKNNPLINLYYSDTDSIYVDKPLAKHLIDSKILGKLKLEYICKKSVFISPKVYFLETIDGKIIYKVKGLKHEVELSLNDFESLLNKDLLIKKTQNK
jgi:DNA polymerase elongation subunit (family B)